MNNSDLLHALKRDWIILRTNPPSNIGTVKIPTLDLDLSLDSGAPKLALTEDGLERLLIPVAKETVLEDNTSGRGIGVFLLDLISSDKKKTFIDLRCLDSRHSDTFMIVVSEIMACIKEGSPPQIAVRDVLNDFRELLRKERTALSREKLLGLIGELTFLCEISNYNPEVIWGWTGPKGTIHDFDFPDVNVEIKSSLRRHGRVARIHGFEQLCPKEANSLFLAHQVFEAGSTSDLTISRLFDRLKQRSVNLHHLSSLLKLTGVEDPNSEELNKEGFRLINRSIYRVTNDFPGITHRSFVTGSPPSGVINCTYDLDLEAAAQFELHEYEVTDLFRQIAS